MACSLRFYGDGVSFLGCLWPIILFVTIFGLTQGPSWWREHLSAKTESSVRVSGRLAGHIMGWHLLPLLGPSQIILAALCSLLGPPVVKQLMQAVLILPGEGGQFWSMVP